MGCLTTEACACELGSRAAHCPLVETLEAPPSELLKAIRTLGSPSLKIHSIGVLVFGNVSCGADVVHNRMFICF